MLLKYIFNKKLPWCIMELFSIYAHAIHANRLDECIMSFTVKYHLSSLRDIVHFHVRIFYNIVSTASNIILEHVTGDIITVLCSHYVHKLCSKIFQPGFLIFKL